MARENAEFADPFFIPSNRYVFSSEEFERIMLNSKSRDLPGRIQEIFIPNSIPERSARIFNLIWSKDSKSPFHAIKVSFTCEPDLYYSYSKFLNTENLSVYFPGYLNPEYKANLKICTLRVEEIGGFVTTGGATTGGETTRTSYIKKEDKLLLFMWFTLSGYLGELRTMQLSIWHDMLDEASQMILLSLCGKFKIKFKRATLVELAEAVYAATNHGAELTGDLQILCKLLWGSYLWRQAGIHKNLAVTFAEDATQEGKKRESTNSRL